MAGGCLKIRYTGAQASCLLVGDSAAKTLTSLIGAAGAEAPDAAFGVAGVIDLTAATTDTLAELAAVIDAYAGYTCTLFYGDDIPAENILSLRVQAKTEDAYVLFELVSALGADALITWTYAQAMLNRKNSEQILVERLINAASLSANAYTGRLLAARTLTRVLDGTNCSKLRLPEWPVNALTSLYVDETRVFAPTSLITDYLLYSDSGLVVYEDHDFPRERQSIKAVFDCGYPVASMPDDIRAAVLEIVQWYLSRLVGVGIGMRAIQSPDGVVTQFELDLPLSARAKLDPYRRVI